MKRHLIARAAPALLAAVLFLPAGVLAQSAPGGPPAAAPAPAAASKAPAAATPGEKAMMQRVDRRIADLHAKLHITAAEEPQWREFADTMRANARKMDREFSERTAKFGSLNAVQNMQSYAEIAQQHAENMQRLVPAFRKLYDALSPQQKHTADALWRSYSRRSAAHGKG